MAEALDRLLVEDPRKADGGRVLRVSLKFHLSCCECNPGILTFINPCTPGKPATWQIQCLVVRVSTTGGNIHGSEISVDFVFTPPARWALARAFSGGSNPHTVSACSERGFRPI